MYELNTQPLGMYGISISRYLKLVFKIPKKGQKNQPLLEIPVIKHREPPHDPCSPPIHPINGTLKHKSLCAQHFSQHVVKHVSSWVQSGDTMTPFFLHICHICHLGLTSTRCPGQMYSSMFSMKVSLICTRTLWRIVAATPKKKKGTVSHGSKSLSCWKWME